MSETLRRRVAVWLFACCTLLFILIVVGGITRLTRSGLSIVEWQPIVGTLPPLTEADWLELFDKYKQSPEYKRINFGMTLDAFKQIFWWEYVHRLLGRVLGLAFLVPLVWFLMQRQLDRTLGHKLIGIFVLGALQGGLGWYMVKSGLVDDPRVSHLRLTAHLGLAFLIFAAMFWIGLDVLRNAVRSNQEREDNLGRYALALVWLVFAMVLTGGLVAGIRAGAAYNTFPLMNGHLIPPEILMIEPWYLNFLNNMATVQFDHRMVAWILALTVPVVWVSCRKTRGRGSARLAATALLITLAVQIALGISTLLTHVPVPLAAAHQAGAVVVFATSLWLAHVLRKTRRPLNVDGG